MNASWQMVGLVAVSFWMVLLVGLLAPLVLRKLSNLRSRSTPLRFAGALALTAAAIAYGGTKPTPTTYEIRYVDADAAGKVVSQACEPGKVYNLTPPDANTGRVFGGWACSNGRRYDDGMLVFNLANPGETVTMTAIWE